MRTSVLKSIATIGGWTMISRVLGFVRDVLIANFLGAGMIADAFFVAFKLPNLFRSLFAEGAFNVAFVPLFSEQLELHGREKAQKFAVEAMSALFYVVLLFTAIAEIAMPLIILVQAPGFVEDPAKFNAAVIMSRITFPYLLLVSLNSLQSGVLNSLGYFAAAALTPVLLNMTMIAALFALTPLFGGNYGYALATGVTIAGVLQLVWLIWHTRRAGMPLGILAPWTVVKRKTAELSLLLKRIIPGVFGSGIYQINLFLDTLFFVVPDHGRGVMAVLRQPFVPAARRHYRRGNRNGSAADSDAGFKVGQYGASQKHPEPSLDYRFGAVRAVGGGLNRFGLSDYFRAV